MIHSGRPGTLVLVKMVSEHAQKPVQKATPKKHCIAQTSELRRPSYIPTQLSMIISLCCTVLSAHPWCWEAPVSPRVCVLVSVRPSSSGHSQVATLSRPNPGPVSVNIVTQERSDPGLQLVIRDENGFQEIFPFILLTKDHDFGGFEHNINMKDLDWIQEIFLPF